MTEEINRSYRQLRYWYSEMWNFGGSTSQATYARNDYDRSGDAYLHGIKNPFHREQIRAGMGASTPLDAYKAKYIYRPGRIRINADSADVNIPSPTMQLLATGYLIPLGNWPTLIIGGSNVFDSPNPTDPIVYDKALAKFYAAANKEIRALQGGVVLGELTKTLHLIKHPAQALRKEVGKFITRAKKVRKISRRSARSKAFANTWLESTYGWRPLLADISDGNKALQRFITGRPLLLKEVRGRATSDNPNPFWDIPKSSAYFTGYLYWTWISRMHYGCDVQILGAVKVNPPGFRQSLQNFGFDPGSIVPTAWELIPWSFLIDYFTDIGDVINAWSFPQGNLAWVQATERNWRDLRSEDVRAQFLVPHHLFEFDPGKITERRNWVKRTPLRPIDLPIPGFHLKVPGMQSLKWLNIAALVAAKRS